VRTLFVKLKVVRTVAVARRDRRPVVICVRTARNVVCGHTGSGRPVREIAADFNVVCRELADLGVSSATLPHAIRDRQNDTHLVFVHPEALCLLARP
jgi:hypothetical protein